MVFAVTIVMVDGRLNFLVCLFVSLVWTFIACCVYCTEEMEEVTFFVVWSGGRGWRRGGSGWRGGGGGAWMSQLFSSFADLAFVSAFVLPRWCVCVRAGGRVLACVRRLHA